MTFFSLLQELFGLGDFNRERLGGAMRSPMWNEVRRDYMILHPDCEACGRKNSRLSPLQVHHCEPFHIKPELELDPRNLITLCGDCHLILGHLRSFKSFNKDIRADAKVLLEKIKARP